MNGKMAKMKFADLAKIANTQNKTEVLSKIPPPRYDKVGEDNGKYNKPRCQSNDNKDIFADTYFIPTTSGENIFELKKVTLPGKMSGFTRMESYTKFKPKYQESETEMDSYSIPSAPLLDPNTSVETSDMITIRGCNRPDVMNLDPSCPLDQKPRINPFSRRRAGGIDLADSSDFDDPSTSGTYTGRRGVVIDPFEQGNLRSKLKLRLRRIVEDRLTVRQIFKRYVEHSTLHGFLYTCSDTYFIRRFLWACLMILGAVYFLVKLKEGVIEYLEYPFSTLSTIDHVKTLAFPAISFCLINSFKTEELKKSKFKPLYEQRRFPINYNWTDPGYDIPGDEFVKELKNVSLTIDDMFEGCDWILRNTNHPLMKANKCDAKNFTEYFNDKGQMCYTLNSGKKGHPVLSVEQKGLNYGYDALFDMKTLNAFRTHAYNGLKVVIHSQDEPPNMENGFILAPGFKFYIKMRMHQTNNLPPPYGTECGEIDLKYYDKYNQKACLLEGLTNYVGEKCGCREAFMAENKKLPICSLRETITCSFYARESFNEFEYRKKCPIDCEQHYFKYQKTDARFLHNPPKGVEPILMQSDAERKGQNTSHLIKLQKSKTSFELDQYVENNLIKVIFFYGEISKEIHDQEATFDFYQFLGDMGGEIGLMLGASLLTFVEFMDLIIFLLYHQFLRLYKQKQIEDIFDDADEEKEDGNITEDTSNGKNSL